MDFEGEIPEGAAVPEVVAEEGDTARPPRPSDEIANIVAIEGEESAAVDADVAEAPGDIEGSTVVVAAEDIEEAPATVAPSERVSADVVPAAGRRRLPLSAPTVGRKVGVLLVAVFVLAFSGIAYATYDYDTTYDGKLLPGIVIAGVDVGGMSPEEALKAVRAAGRIQLDRVITVGYEEKKWTVTPRKLGAKSNARSLVDAALAESESTGMLAKASMAVFGNGLDLDSELAITYPRQGIRGFIDGVSAALDREPIDAGVDYSSGWLEFTEPKEGRRVLRKQSRRALSRALKREQGRVTLAVKTTEPEVTEQKWDKALLVRIGENKLYLYEDGEITKEYVIATGMPDYMTPVGEYYITEKRYMPTWVNPDPEGWGANMPASIGPGPGNPLGTRALNWSIGGIRFHGTEATYSLGYNASHGCVRLSMPDIEELYELVDVGTPIVSLVAGPLKPQYSSSGAAN